MIRKNFLNLSHFFVFVCAVFLGLNFFAPTREFIYSYGKPYFLLEAVFLIVLLYVGMSLIHHYQDKSLTLITASEYILIALLVIVILTGAI